MKSRQYLIIAVVCSVALVMAGIATAATITTTYQYDPLGRLTGEQHSTGMVITYAYDANGNRTGRVVSVTLPQFSATPVTGNSPLTVAFSDLSTGNITSWLWDFGDGGTSAVQNPGYTYNIPGTYTVTLTLNGSFTLTKTLYIAVNPVLTVSLTGSGGGSVNSDIAGIACTFPPQAGNCAAGYPPTTGTVTLSAAPNTDSIFGGWSGACTNLTGKCPVPLTTNNSAGAIFTYVLPVQLFRAPPVPYSSFLTAYTAALPGEIIQARSVDLGETLILNNGITVSFKGGYDSTFTTQGGVTTVKGITIQQGTLIVDHMVIK